MRPRSVFGAARPLALVAAVALALGLAAAPAAGAAPTTQPPPPLAVLDGTITTAAGNTHELRLAKQRVTAGKSGRVLVAVEVQASDGALDPGRVTVRESRTGLDVRLFHQHDTRDTLGTYLLAVVKPGATYELTVTRTGTGTGPYTATVTLPGDVDTDGALTSADLAAIHAARGTGVGHPRYVPAADVNRSGRINVSDTTLAAISWGTTTRPDEPAPPAVNPIDVPLPEGALTITGSDPGTLHPVGSDVTFALDGSTFDTDPATSTVTVDGQPLTPDRVERTESRLTATDALRDGRNVVRLRAFDSAGRPLHHETTLWAGSRTLTVQVVDDAGQPFTAETEVTLQLADDPSVETVVTTTDGSAEFSNVPLTTVVASATSPGMVTGSSGGIGSAGTLTIPMTAVPAPNDVDNNDFSLGLEGWDVGTAPASVVPHTEDVGPASGAAAPAARAAAPADRTSAQAQRTSPDEVAAASEAAGDASEDAATAALVDQDLALLTSDEGEQAVSRTFTTDPDVVGVRVRYRFWTSEVPGGYFGSQYNDYFRVSLTSGQGGGSRNESNSMNALGLAAFDGTGSTAWRELVLPVDEAGDTVHVALAVANVADGALDSAVYVDFVEELRVRIVPSLRWDATTGGLALSYTVETDEPLAEARDIEVHFAGGPTRSDAIGAAVHTLTVPAGTGAGSYGPVHIDGADLADDPTGTTHLVASSSPHDVGAVADVTVAYGPNADAGVVAAGMLDAVKDGLRVAGQPNATITSTARTPADQARAMFNNLANPANTIAQNVATQLGIYAAPGDAVVNVFAAQAAGMTHAQVNANRAAIEAAMLAEIDAQGCGNVSRHCGDPAVVSVIDVGAGAFAANGARFFQAVTARVTRSIDERGTNNCYHFEYELP